MPDTLPPPDAPRAAFHAASGRAPTPDEIIQVDDAVVACDGGGGPLGHPRVFLRIVAREVMCPYCSRLYVLREGAGHALAH